MKLTKMLVSLAMVAMLACTACVGFASEAIQIGFIGPLTGGAAVYGVSCKQGCEIAVEEINALGGIQLALNAQDDEHDAEKSVNAYYNLMDAEAQMIVGCVTTNPCIAVAAEAYNDRMFMLTPSASSTQVTEGRDNVYQVCFTDPAQGALSAQYIVENKLAAKVAVIYNNADAYSTGIFQTFAAQAAQMGLEIVSVGTFTNDTTDFSVQLTDAKNNGAELVFLPIYYTPASMILNQANSMEYAPKFFGVDGMDGILTMPGFDTALAEGVMLLTPFSADAQDELTVNFVTKYVAAYGETPTQFSADGYDAVYALYYAIQNAGITAETSYEECCELLMAEMQELTMVGTTGSMDWDANGVVTKSPTAVVIKDGVYVGM